MALTGYQDTGAILTGSYTFRINGRLNYDVSRLNNTLTFSNVYAQGQFYSPNGGASFSYPSGWDIVGDVASGSQRVSGFWTGSRSAGSVDTTGTAGPFTVGVGQNDSQINVRVGARFRNDGMTYTQWTIGIPTTGTPSHSARSVSNIGQKSADISVTAVAGSNANFLSSNSSALRIQYGLTTSYGNNMDQAGNNGGANQSQSKTFNLTNLQPGSTYHYRLVFTNGSGKTYTSGDYTFDTLPVPAISLPLLRVIGVM